jgi:hypothetical protein
VSADNILVDAPFACGPVFTMTSIVSAALAGLPLGYAINLQGVGAVRKGTGVPSEADVADSGHRGPFPSTQSLDHHAALICAVTMMVPLTVAPLIG